jgi:hypothetical protein
MMKVLPLKACDPVSGKCCNYGRYMYAGRFLCKMHYRLAMGTWGYRGSGRPKPKPQRADDQGI